MHHSPKIHSAVDAVRCLYLARVALREGHARAARRLEAKAIAWTNKHVAETGEPLPRKRRRCDLQAL